MIICEVVPEDKLEHIGQEPEPHLSPDNIGWNIKPPISVHQIEQQVERATQSITNYLIDYVNWQVGWLEAILSKHISLNDNGQQEDMYD